MIMELTIDEILNLKTVDRGDYIDIDIFSELEAIYANIRQEDITGKIRIDQKIDSEQTTLEVVYYLEVPILIYQHQEYGEKYINIRILNGKMLGECFCFLYELTYRNWFDVGVNREPIDVQPYKNAKLSLDGVNLNVTEVEW